MTAGLVRANRHRGIQQEHPLTRPPAQVSAFRIGRPRIPVDFPEDIDQGRRVGNSVTNREAQSVGLPGSVIWILPDNYNLQRIGIAVRKGGKNLRPFRKTAMRLVLPAYEIGEFTEVRFIEFRLHQGFPIRIYFYFHKDLCGILTGNNRLWGEITKFPYLKLLPASVTLWVLRTIRTFGRLSVPAMRIARKTLEDLEFPEVLDQLEAFCQTEPGRLKVRELVPLQDAEMLTTTMARVSDYAASFENDNTIPAHGFEPLDEALGVLKVENSLLPVAAFQHMADLAALVGTHQRFFKKFAEYYPTLEQWVVQTEYHSFIPERIGEVIDRFGEIRDDASEALGQIRQRMERARSGIDKSFNAALGTYQRAEYLDEIRESVVENRRVLAVKAMYRRKVKGNVMGTSKTGSIVYIEPEATQRHSRELQLL